MLVLLTVERASGIDEYAAGFEGVPCVLHDAALTVGTEAYVGLAPLGDGIGVLTEHPFARTGSVYQHAIEQVGQLLAEVNRLIMSDYRVAIAPLLNVFGEDEDALADDLVADEESLAAQILADEGGLAPGRGTEVKDDAVGFDKLLQDLLEEHAARLLHIVAARVKERVEGKLGSRAQVVAVFVPRHLAGVGIEGEAVNLVVETYGRDGLALQCVEEQVGIVGPQLLLHAMNEIYGQHTGLTEKRLQSYEKYGKYLLWGRIFHHNHPDSPR